MKQPYLLLAALMLFCTACGKLNPSGDVLAEVNGKSITTHDLDFLGTINPRIKMQMASPIGKQQLLDNLIEQQLLYDEAVRKGFNRKADVKAKADLYRRVIVSQALVDSAVDTAAKKYYDAHQDEFKKLGLSHIMINYMSEDEVNKAKKDKRPLVHMHTEAEALQLINDAKARIDKGEAFSKVAEEVSEDISTKTRGGDLGKASKTERRLLARGFEPLLEKAFELKVGEVAGPIKTQRGYHLITVTSPIELEPYEAVSDLVMMQTRNQTRDELLAQLKKSAKIIYPAQEKAKQAPVPAPTPPQNTPGALGTTDTNKPPAVSAITPSAKPIETENKESKPAGK